MFYNILYKIDGACLIAPRDVNLLLIEEEAQELSKDFYTIQSIGRFLGISNNMLDNLSNHTINSIGVELFYNRFAKSFRKRCYKTIVRHYNSLSRKKYAKCYC